MPQPPRQGFKTRPGDGPGTNDQAALAIPKVWRLLSCWAVSAMTASILERRASRRSVSRQMVSTFRDAGPGRRGGTPRPDRPRARVRVRGGREAPRARGGHRHRASRRFRGRERGRSRVLRRVPQQSGAPRPRGHVRSRRKSIAPRRAGRGERGWEGRRTSSSTFLVALHHRGSFKNGPGNLLPRACWSASTREIGRCGGRRSGKPKKICVRGIPAGPPPVRIPTTAAAPPDSNSVKARSAALTWRLESRRRPSGTGDHDTEARRAQLEVRIVQVADTRAECEKRRVRPKAAYRPWPSAAIRLSKTGRSSLLQHAGPVVVWSDWPRHADTLFFPAMDGGDFDQISLVCGKSSAARVHVSIA